MAWAVKAFQNAMAAVSIGKGEREVKDHIGMADSRSNFRPSTTFIRKPAVLDTVSAPYRTGPSSSLPRPSL